MTHPVTVHPIRDDASYEAAAADVRRLWGAEPGTPEGDRLDVLLVLVDAYEAAQHAIELPDPIEAIKIRMDDLELTRDDLGAMLGLTSGRVSEVLNRRRRLTLGMIRDLAAKLKLSEACLLQPYDLVPSGTVRRASGTGKQIRKQRVGRMRASAFRLFLPRSARRCVPRFAERRKASGGRQVAERAGAHPPYISTAQE
jgi:HTH-type transcriptional regulator/antitoxin HigA